MKVDNWELKKLFHFDNEHRIVLNDTESTITIKSRDGQDVSVKPTEKTRIMTDNHSIVLPNNCTIKYSDKKPVVDTDFGENFNVVIAHLVTKLREGHVIDGLNFLDYHYKWTKEKKRFLTFIKHYIISVSWTQQEDKKNFKVYSDAVADWVEEKRKRRKRPFYILVLTIPLVVYAVGWILSPTYKEIFIGALIGGIAAPLKEVYDLMAD